MLKKSQKHIIIAISALVLIGFGALVVHNYKTKTSLKYNEENTAASKPQENPQDAVAAAVNNDAAVLAETRKNSDLLQASSSDFILGDNKAPVLMIEYASLSSIRVILRILFTFTSLYMSKNHNRLSKSKCIGETVSHQSKRGAGGNRAVYLPLVNWQRCH
jgi:hypothetical protein